MTKLKKRSLFEKDLIIHYKKPGMSIARLKYFEHSIEEKNRIIKRIYSKALPGSSYIFKGLIASNISEVNTTRFVPYHDEINILSHLEWIVLVLNQYKSKLKKYLNLKNKYIEYLTQDDYFNANIVLEEIQAEITYSIWGIEQSLLCAEMISGLEGKAEKLSEFGKNTKSYLVVLLSDFFSSKVEVTTSHTSFNHKVNSFINQFSDDELTPQIYKSYLEFQFMNELYNFDLNKMKLVLSLSATLPLIDLYENLIKIITIISSSSKYDDPFKKSAVNLLKLLDLSLNDFRINKLLVFNQLEPLDEIPMKEQNVLSEAIIEQYTIGQYIECIDKCINYELKYGLNFAMIKIIAKAIVQSNSNINDFEFKSILLKDKIIKPLVEIYSCINKEKNIGELLSTSKIFGDLPIRYEIESFYLEYKYSYKKDISNFAIKFSNIYSLIVSPSILLDGVEKENEYLLEGLYKQLGYKNTLSILDEKKLKKNKKIPSFRTEYYEAKLLARTNPSKAISHFSEMLTRIQKNIYQESAFLYFYEKIALDLFNLYVNSSNYYEAVNLVVDSYGINESIILRMDNNSLYKRIKDNILNNNLLLQELKLIIFIYLVDKNKSFEIYSIFVSYIESKERNIPSELIDLKLTDGDKKLLNFIFAHIYNKDVMKHFVYLNPSERNNERIKILEYLITQKHGNEELYRNEINEINKIISIQKRIKSVDEKKIYVDINSILNEFDDIYRERFKKYLLLESLDANLKYYDLKEELDLLSSHNQFTDEVQLEFKSNPERKFRYLLFKEMADDFRIQTLTNSKYGLGKFLSSRIRHGVLENTLTKSFKNHKLLSLKQNNDSTNFVLHKERVKELHVYKNAQNENDLITIQELLNDFSVSIVNKVIEIKDWVRIKDKNYPRGLFEYSLFEGQAILFLYNDFKDIADYKSLYMALTDYFWEITELNLKKIRKKLSEEVLDYFFECLETLKSQLDTLRGKDTNLDTLLMTIIKDINLCKVGIKTDLNDISNWFVVRRSNEFHDFQFQELIDTNLEIIRKSDKDCEKIKFNADINSSVKIKGEYFNYLVDIFNMLYSNAIEHSGFTSLEDLVIDTKIFEIKKSEIYQLLNEDNFEMSLIDNLENYNESFKKSTDNFIKIHLKNSLAPEQNSEILRGIIEDKIEAALDIKQSSKLIAEEGGTGITKIYYILKHNLKVLNYQVYSIDDNNWFNVEIYLNISNLTALKEGVDII